MLDSIFAATSGIALGEIVLCTLVSLALGVVIALVYMYRNTYSKNLVVTIALLPALVQSVIMIVNGNLGAGVAVMGAFSLVRFRSAPGTAKEIVSIFFATAVGLAAGMGYLVYAALFTAVMGAAMLLMATLRFGEQESSVKTLKILIPEDTDYTHLFDDLFIRYTHAATLEKVRTTNLGGLYELQYTVKLKELDKEKEFLDQIRQRNGNLNLTCGRLAAAQGEL